MGGYDMSTGAAAKKAAKKAKRPAGKKAPSTTKTGRTMATKKPDSASGLKVRMYRVGFGDFFLVTVPTSAGDRYILIDCGVFKGTSGTGDIGSIEEAVEDLFNTTGGKLALVIMTHRHADHIAGFSRAERFKDFTASMVWMPFWEQFNDAKDSPSSLQFDISQVAEQLALQFRGRADKEAQQALDQLSNATGIDFNATAKGGTRAGGNAAALDLLKNHLGENGKNVRYYAAGDKAELPPELEGLSAEILGPPPKEAKIFMPLTDLKKGVGQYLDSITPSDDGPIAIHPFRPQWQASPSDDYPERDARGFAIKYQDIVNSVDNAQPDMLAAAAAKIETFLNNQSLVVLFTFADKNLLFVGDAQAGNWEYWLYKLDAPIKDPTKAGDIVDQSQQILRTIDFYKVGHHGSTNATPIQAVEAMGKNHSANGFVAMCSTQFDVFGKTANESEVPRTPLMKALGDECALVRSDSFAITTTSKGVIKPAEGAAADLPKPKVGKLATKNLYVEYSF
jgi:beta-lactamase superfamily II metal-dependent hydrolase